MSDSDVDGHRAVPVKRRSTRYHSCDDISPVENVINEIRFADNQNSTLITKHQISKEPDPKATPPKAQEFLYVPSKTSQYANSEQSSLVLETFYRKDQSQIEERHSLQPNDRKDTFLPELGTDEDLDPIDEWFQRTFVEECVYNNRNPREEWVGNCDFTLSVLGLMFGTRNLLFSFFMYANGGIAIIIPQLMIFSIMCYPLLIMETSLGQYTSLGPSDSWNFCKLLKGLSYATIQVSFLEGITYMKRIALYATYFYASFSSPWNDQISQYNTSQVFDKFKTYHDKNILFLHEHRGQFKNFSDWNVSLVISSLVVWTAVTLSLLFGIRTAGKIVRWTATFPVLFIAVILVYVLSLPGAIDGIKYGMNPSLDKLDYGTWVETAKFMFLSLSVSYGGHTALASYNSFKAPVLTATFIAALGDTALGWICSFMTCALFGFMAYTKNLTLKELDLKLLTKDQDLVFVVYPTILEESGGNWNVFFFFTLIFLGIDSPLYNVETVITSLIDIFNLKSSYRKYVVIGVTLTSFSLCIPLLTGSGPELLRVYSSYTTNLFIIALCQSIAIGWIYPAKTFIDQIEFMVGWDVSFLLSYPACKRWLVLCWKFLAPTLIIILLFEKATSIFSTSGEMSDLPAAARYVAFVCEWFAPILLVVTLVVLMLRRKGSLVERFRELRMPDRDWGPATKQHRKMVCILNISNVYYKRKRLRKKAKNTFPKNINI